MSSAKLFRITMVLLMVAIAAAGGVRVLASIFDSRPGELFETGGLFWPPSFDDLELIGVSSLETVNIAFVGTSLGFGLALLASLVVFEFKPGLFQIAALPAWFTRGVPDVVFAVILLQILGPGPLTGIFALALGTFGVSFKLLIDSLQTRTSAPEKPLQLSGIPRLSRIMNVVVPTLFRDFTAQFFVRLEINFRIAIVLGLVGGGGLGFLLDRSLSLMDYPRVTAVLVYISVLVLLGEQSSTIARRLIEKSKVSLLQLWTVPVFVVLGFVWSFLTIWSLSSDPTQRFSSDQAGKILIAFLTPDFASQSTALLSGAFESLSITAFALVFGFPLSVLLSFIASDAVYLTRGIPRIVRVFLGLFRSIPVAVLAVVIVIFVGFGAHSAMIALTLGGGLFLARILSEALESKRMPILENMKLSGGGLANRFTVVIADNKARLVRHFFFSLDFIFRYSVIIGILGGGGLGNMISDALRVQDFRTVTAATLTIIVIVVTIELLQRVFLGHHRQESSTRDRFAS